MRRKGRDVSIAQEYRGPKSQVSKKEMANKRGGKGQAAKAASSSPRFMRLGLGAKFEVDQVRGGDFRVRRGVQGSRQLEASNDWT